MTTPASFEWGRCPCGGIFEHKLVEINMTVDGRGVKLTDVPQGVCPTCGSRVYKAEALARVEGTLRNEALDRRLNRSRV
jgi:YgiT-type zinc finger domain-containing protein